MSRALSESQPEEADVHLNCHREAAAVLEDALRPVHKASTRSADVPVIKDRSDLEQALFDIRGLERTRQQVLLDVDFVVIELVHKLARIEGNTQRRPVSNEPQRLALELTFLEIDRALEQARLDMDLGDQGLGDLRLDHKLNLSKLARFLEIDRAL